MYNCIIIDDDPHAIYGLTLYLQQIPEFKVLLTFTDPIKALKTINSLDSSEKVDLILLDINMPGITGIELSKEIRGKTDKLIFTTAYTKYGYEAFEVNADAYLLKPYSLTKFLTTIIKIFPKINEFSAEGNREDFFFVKSKEDLKIVRINYKDIIAVESKLNYIQIYTPLKNIITYMTIGEMAKKLTDKNFIQFQRSFILNKKCIEYIDGNNIKMNNGINITVGKQYKTYFDEFISKNIIMSKRNKVKEI